MQNNRHFDKLYKNLAVAVEDSRSQSLKYDSQNIR